MVKNQKKEIVYKNRITNLLLHLLEEAGIDTRNATDFEEKFRKRLKFQKRTDWKRFRACVDLLEDTEYAIRSVCEYQLGDMSNDNDDMGEMYLRLYGILNAVYLQMNAYEEIAKLVNYPERDKISSQFETLDIYKLRGMAGAHTIDYRYDKKTQSQRPGIHKTTSFRLIQMYINKSGNRIIVLDENDLSFEFNILEILIEYVNNSTDLLIKLVKHSVKTLVFNKDHKNEILRSLKELLTNLVDYSKINCNQNYLDKENRRLTKLIQKQIRN